MIFATILPCMLQMSLETTPFQSTQHHHVNISSFQILIKINCEFLTDLARYFRRMKMMKP